MRNISNSLQFMLKALALLILVQAGSVAAQLPGHRYGVLIAKPKSGATAEEFLKSRNDQVAIEKTLMGGRILVLRLKNELRGQEEGLARELMQSGEFESVELDSYIEPDRVPNDSEFGWQWHHQKIGSPAAWDITTGKSEIKVAVCDTGVQVDHPDLSSHLILPGFNTVDGSNDIVDIARHGTYVTGIIGAVGNNSLGVTGLAWSVSILPVRISNVATGSALILDAAECIIWAADQGAKVVNLSYQAGSGSIISEAAGYLREKGGLLVTSIGNESRDLTGVVRDDPMYLAIGASTEVDLVRLDSNYGAPLDLVAPGNLLRSTAPGGYYDVFSGASAAVPVVSGVAALIYSLKEDFTPDEVERFLLSTAVDLGVPGEDPTYGAGRIDAGAAVQAAAKAIEVAEELTAAITQPADQAIVSGEVVIQAQVSDSSSVERVEFYVDSLMIGEVWTAVSSDYRWKWDTARAKNGMHQITVRAFDFQGGSSEAKIDVQVLNPVTAWVDNLVAPQQDVWRTYVGNWCNSKDPGFKVNPAVYSCGVGTDVYRLIPRVAVEHTYKIFLRWVSSTHFTKNATIKVIHAGGETTKKFNQQKNGSRWVLHGEYVLKTGRQSYVEFSDEGGKINVDAIAIEPVR